jgi:hypothetical protein
MDLLAEHIIFKRQKAFVTSDFEATDYDAKQFME